MAKRAQLVTQHLEDISRDALDKFRDVVKGYVRGRQGVYSLYRGKKLYYVGLASNLRTRLNQHLKDRHGHSWDRFSVYLTIGDQHLKELEALILRMVKKPAGNKQSGRFIRSQDLRRQFKRAIRRRQEAELDQLLGTIRVGPLAPEPPNRNGGRAPILAQYANRPTELRVRYKGTLFKARVRRDGSIRYAGKLFTSPSQAGSAVCKHACDGWKFWTYERAPGDWVLLDELRKG